MELSDILKHIDNAALEKQRRLSKNNITVRISDADLEMLALIKGTRNIKTSAAIKEALDFYSNLLIINKDKQK